MRKEQLHEQKEGHMPECVLPRRLIKRLHMHKPINTPGVMFSLALCIANSTGVE